MTALCASPVMIALESGDVLTGLGRGWPPSSALPCAAVHVLHLLCTAAAQRRRLLSVLNRGIMSHLARAQGAAGDGHVCAAERAGSAAGGRRHPGLSPHARHGARACMPGMRKWDSWCPLLNGALNLAADCPVVPRMLRLLRPGRGSMGSRAFSSSGSPAVCADLVQRIAVSRLRHEHA